MKHVEENEVAINESKEDEEDEENGDYSNDEVAAKKTAGKGWSAPVQLSSTLAAFIGQESCASTAIFHQFTLTFLLAHLITHQELRLQNWYGNILKQIICKIPLINDTSIVTMLYKQS